MLKNNLLSTRWFIVFGLAALVAATLFATGAFLRTASAVTPRYVATTGADAGTCTPIGSACLTISYAISVSAPGDTINVATGTYSEDVDLNQAGLTLVGAGAALTTIDYAGQSGYNNAGMYVQADNVTVQDLTLTRSISGSTPRYGLKVGTYAGVTISGVTVSNSYRTGLDALGASNLTITGVTLTSNGGHGMQLLDVNAALVSDVTISGTGWNDLSVATWGRYSPLGTSGVVISGTNSFGGNLTDDGGLQLEEGNYSFPLNPQSISWSTLLADGADVTIQPSDFGYALSGPSDDGQPRTKFYDTLANAQNAAAGSPSHIQPYDRFLRTTNGLAEQTNYYVYDLAGDTMSIQAAIDAAAPGDIVNVADGTYTATSLASVVITKDGLSLIGQSRDGTIIDGGAWGTSNAGWPKGIHAYANNVTIQNLTVRGFTGDMITTGGYGIVFRDYAHDMPSEGWIFYTGSVVDNVKVENNYSAIYALVNRYLTVRNSLIQNNFSDGMFIARESDNATITGNTVLNSGDHGIWVGYDWGALGPSDNATITGNVVNGAREGGISFVASDTALISGNDVSNVKGEEPEGAGGWSRGAISLKDGVSNVTVSNNVVHDNDGLGTGSGRGIGVDGTSTNVTIAGNVIRNNAGGGIKVQGTTSGWSANYNSIYSNAGYGAENTTGSILDFEKNWWGDATGADHASNPHGTGQGGDAVSNNVDFEPWYATSTTTPASENVTVTHNPIIAVSDTIQGAIDAALAGDTVSASAGTYPEYLHIGKDGLTLQGAGIDQTIIDLDGVTPYNQFGFMPSGYSVGGILVSGYGTTNNRVYNVTIRDLTVQNAGVNSGTGWAGARDDDSNGDGDVSGINIVSGYDVSVIDSKIINSTRHGIYYDRPVTTLEGPRWHSMNAVVTGSTVSNNAFSGISTGFHHGTVNISGNTVENNVKNGIFVRGGKDKGDNIFKYATGSVTGNQVRNNASGADSYGGIFIKNQSTGIEVSGNTVTGHNLWSESFGIMTGYKENTGTLIHDNIVTGNIRAIIGFNGATGGKIYDNTITTDSGIYDTGQAAIKLDGVSGFEVYDNSLSSLSGIGIMFNNWGDFAGIPASNNNLVYRNTIDAPRFAGIYLRELAYDNTFTNNAITNVVSDTFAHNHDWGQHDGGANQAILTDSGAAWTPGHFVGWTVMNLSDGSEGTITANTATTITATLAGGTENDWDDGDWYDLWFDVTRQVGIYLEGGDSSADLHAGTGNVFNNNSVTGWATYAVDNEIAATVDASSNWWGSNDAATLSAAMNGNVDYSPWIHDGTDQDLVTKGYQPDLSYLHVDDDSAQSGVAGHIQEGIDLVTASTVNVEPGTYPGSITIDKALTLSCAQAGVAVTSRTEGSAAESIIDLTGSYSGIVITSSDVTVDGCDIIGDAATNDGVYVAASANSFSNITVANNFIHGMAKENTSNASVYSYGVLADAKVSETGPFGSISALSITGNSIHDIGGVVDGTITSGGLGLSLHEISGASAGDGVTVTGNIFNGINDGWDGSSAAPAAGVSVLENGLQTSPSSGASVTGNSYTDTTGGVAVFATSSSVSETGGSFTNVQVLVLNIGRLATIDEVALGQFAKSDTLTLVPFSDGYFAKIQDAIDNSDPGATISVAAGTYTEAVTVNKDVTLTGLNPPAGGSAAIVNGTVDLTADGATVESLRVVPGSVTSDERAIAVYAGNTTVTGNLIDGMTGDGTGVIVGVGIYGGSKPALLNISVTNNVIKNIDNQQPGVSFSGADGIMVQGVVDGVAITGNTIEDIRSAGWAYGIEITPTAADPANPPQSVQVLNNSISLVNEGSVYNVMLDPYAAPYPGVGLIIDEVSPGSDDGDASQVTVTYNDFVALIVGAFNKDTDQILNAENNWWDACDGPSGVGPGSGVAVGTNVDYDPWNASKCDKDGDFLTDDEEIFIYGTDPNNPDTDGDGCLDGVEVLPKSIVANGGGRDPLNQWDFYDVTGDRYIDLFNDILGVIQHYSLDGSSPYDVNFDRGPTAGPNPWNMTAPDGAIDLFTDILGVIGQHGHSCQ